MLRVEGAQYAAERQKKMEPGYTLTMITTAALILAAMTRLVVNVFEAYCAEAVTGLSD